jgi:FlaA1/EpsC-like NDP-sugar epimerase
MEANSCQAILNNIIGTKNLVDLSLNSHVQTFVNISTDKAINPTSIMGASKRVAEFIVEDAAKNTTNGQKYVSVRFGNVLGSRGSVIPIFKEQIKRGGPVTVTHPDMKRYFMTIPEASQLVLQAGALNQNGAVFVLDMGEPVKIVDMARDLIRLSGLEPDRDIAIKFTGMKSGEKLYEELLNTEEGTNVTQHESIFVARKATKPKNLDKNIEEMLSIAKTCDSQQIKKIFKKMVPSYSGIDE